MVIGREIKLRGERCLQFLCDVLGSMCEEEIRIEWVLVIMILFC